MSAHDGRMHQAGQPPGRAGETIALANVTSEWWRAERRHRTYREDEMSSATDLAARPESMVDDYDAICRTVQLCLDGEATGDANKLREAFHEDARIFGSLAGDRFDGPFHFSSTWRQPRPQTLGATDPASCPCSRSGTALW